jgi:hypothetical protein
VYFCRLSGGSLCTKIFEMSVIERLQNIFRHDKQEDEESISRSEALEREHAVTMAFFEGKVTLEEYNAVFEQTHLLTNTEYKGNATISDKK